MPQIKTHSSERTCSKRKPRFPRVQLMLRRRHDDQLLGLLSAEDDGSMQSPSYSM